AAALADGVRGRMAPDRRLVIVEPDSAACVASALEAGRVVRVPGDLKTSAEMLSCGVASAPAVEILLRHGGTAITLRENALARTASTLAACGGPATTPSGAAGLAGLLVAPPGSQPARELGLDGRSRVLLVATEGPLPPGDDA